MGQIIELSASHGHRPAAYLSSPTGAARGGIAVIAQVSSRRAQSSRSSAV